MKAAYVCRACRRGLQATPTSQATLRLDSSSLRRFTTNQQRHEAVYPGSNPSLGPQERVTGNNELRGSGRSNEVASREDAPSLPLAAEGSQVLKALTQGAAGDSPNRSTERKQKTQKARTRSSKKSRAVGEKGEQRQEELQKAHASRRNQASIDEGEGELPRAPSIDKKRIERYLQWGYLRHVPPGSGLLESKKEFNFWRSWYNQAGRNKRPTTAPWFDDGKWLLEKKKYWQIKHSWERLDEEQRRKMWPGVMLSVMFQSPKALWRIFSATLDPLPPGYAIADVLLYIAQGLQHRQGAGTIKRHRRRKLVFDLVVHLLKTMPPGYMPFKQRTFGILAQVFTTNQNAVIYAILKESKARFHPNTALHFARSLAGRATDVEHKAKAFEILQGLANDGADLNRPEVASAITSLLHCEAPNDLSPSEGGSFSPTHALQFFMENGFIPNVVTLTAYLDSLCQRREVEEVIRLAKLFTNNGLKLDDTAFSTIFRGAKTSFDASKVQEVLYLTRQMGKPSINVLNNALHAMFFFSEMEVREGKASPSEGLRPFVPMLRVYAKKFSLKPLQSLIPDSLPFLVMGESNVQAPRLWEFERTILPVVDEFFSNSDTEPIEPDSATLATMLRAYIKSLWRPYDLMSLYTYFKDQLENGEHEGNYAAELVRNEGSLIHDTFILAMLQQPGLTRPALEIFGDQLKSHLHPQKKDESGAELNPVHPMPSVFTFGILLSGLMRRRERELADQVIQVMKENGIKPNIATWNIQIKGFALMQNVPRTVDALQSLEASGFRPDAHTFKAFGHLRDQKRALKVMEKIIDTNKEKKMEDERRLEEDEEDEDEEDDE